MVRGAPGGQSGLVPDAAGSGIPYNERDGDLGCFTSGGVDGESEVMNSIFFLVPLALILGGIFAFLFILAVRDGQFDDLDDPPERILHD